MFVRKHAKRYFRVARDRKAREREKLTAIAAVLNGERRKLVYGVWWLTFGSAACEVFRDGLRRLVDAWLAAGRDVGKLALDCPELWKEVVWFAKHARYLAIPSRRGQVPTVMLSVPPEYCHSFAPGIADPEACFWLSARPILKRWTLGAQIRYDVGRVFHDLLTSEYKDKFGKCRRCARYFVGRRGRVYCSVRCGTRATAKQATEKKRQTEREARLRRAQRFARKWMEPERGGGADGRGDPKRWIASQTGLSLSWLTRAAKHNGLKIPKIVKKEGDA
jgi:hypothetical protein